MEQRVQYIMYHIKQYICIIQTIGSYVKSLCSEENGLRVYIRTKKYKARIRLCKVK